MCKDMRSSLILYAEVRLNMLFRVYTFVTELCSEIKACLMDYDAELAKVFNDGLEIGALCQHFWQNE